MRLSNCTRLGALALILSGALATTACTSNSSEAPGRSGFLGDTYDQLKVDPNDSDVMIWAAEADVLGKYDKFIVDAVQIDFGPDAKGTDESKANLATLQESLHKAMVDALSQGDTYQVVDAAGDGVCRISVAITSVDDSEWYLNVLPQTKLTGMGLGGAAMEAKATDASSGDLVMAVMQAESGTRFSMAGLSTWGDAEAVMGHWAEHLRARIDAAHAAK